MEKEDVAHIYNGILLSHKKKQIMPFAATWVDLEIIILNEVSQTEKDKYHMISLIYHTISLTCEKMIKIKKVSYLY